MNELSIANIEFLKKEIRNSGLTYSHLMDDMIDHVCCDVESHMQRGLPFDKAYETVKKNIGMEGLERIQHETLYLINKNYRIMKKTMRFFGVAAPIILAFGALFKLMHWPGAGILMVLGFFFLSFLFLPSAIYVSYIEVSNRTKKWTYVAGFIGTFFLSLSFLFKLMHWPGTGIMLLLSILLICLVFLPSLIIHKLRQKEFQTPKYIFVLALLGLIIFLIGFDFKMMHWPGAGILFLAGTILLFFVAFPLYVYKTYKESVTIENSFIFIVIALIWFIVPTTLLSLNVSINVMDNMFTNQRNIESGIQMMQEKNNQLMIKLDKNQSAATIDKQTKELLSFIQQVKVDMGKIAEGQTSSIGTHNEIDINRLNNYTAINIFNLVVYNKDARGAKLNKLLKDYRETLKKACSDIKNQTLIDPLLVYDLNQNDDADEVLLASINKLSYLQLNIMHAEQTVLRQLNKHLLSSVSNAKR